MGHYHFNQEVIKLILIVTAIILALLLIPYRVTYQAVEDNHVEAHQEAPEGPISPVDALSWQMREIARCESGMRQFNPDGSVLRGVVNSKDVGMFQINEFYHLADAKRLGYNIYTLEGNIGYAKHLVRTQGYRPWVHSNSCHRLLS